MSPFAEARSSAFFAAYALTIESALANTASETFKESLRIIAAFGRLPPRPPPPPPPPPPCAAATELTVANTAAVINAVRIILFIALAPSGNVDSFAVRTSDAHLGTITAGLRHQLTGAPIPAQRQAFR